VVSLIVPLVYGPLVIDVFSAKGKAQGVITTGWALMILILKNCQLS